jgi:hypothetical protein
VGLGNPPLNCLQLNGFAIPLCAEEQRNAQEGCHLSLQPLGVEAASMKWAHGLPVRIVLPSVQSGGGRRSKCPEEERKPERGAVCELNTRPPRERGWIAGWTLNVAPDAPEPGWCYASLRDSVRPRNFTRVAISSVPALRCNAESYS